MERSRTWRDVKWAVLGGETLRAQESEGTWACMALGAGTAKHKCVYQQGHVPTRPWVCVPEWARPGRARPEGHVRSWGAMPGEVLLEVGAGCEGVSGAGRKHARLRWAVAQNAILLGSGSRPRTVPRQLEGQGALASSRREVTSL